MPGIQKQVECLGFDLGYGKTSVSVSVEVTGFAYALVCGRVNAYTWTATSAIYWRLILESRDVGGTFSRFDDGNVELLKAPAGTTISDGHVRNDTLLRSGALASDFEFTLRLYLTQGSLRFIYSPNGAVGNSTVGCVVMGIDPINPRD